MDLTVAHLADDILLVALHPAREELEAEAVFGTGAKVLVERAASLDGAFFQGLPYIMIGSLHAFRPPMFGGSPEKSLASFEAAFAVGGDSFLLSKYFYARYYLYRIQDGDEFRRVLQGVVDAPDASENPYRLLNLIARKRSATLMGEADDLF